MNPTIGRIVHYVLPAGSAHRGEHRAAMITGVHGDGVNLTVFVDQPGDASSEKSVCHPDGQLLASAVDVKHDEQLSTGTWHWPEREA